MTGPRHEGGPGRYDAGPSAVAPHAVEGEQRPEGIAPVRPFRAEWIVTALSAVRGSVVDRTVIGALGDRASPTGVVAAHVADLAACACLPVLSVQAVIVELSSQGLLGNDRHGRLVLVLPPGGRSG